MGYKAAIFDMDGTILDTVADLRDALNHTFRDFDHRSDFSEDEVKLFFGGGAAVAIRRALAVENGFPLERLEQIGTKDEPSLSIDEKLAEEIRAAYTPYYAEHCNIKTGPYPGILPMLRNLKRRGIGIAVVSNKPDEAVQSLNREHFEGLFDYAAGEVRGIRRKPYPDMVEKALGQLKTDRREAVYIGDSEVDIQTASNSGLDCISVDWGFRSRAFLMLNRAGCIASSCEDIEDVIFG